MIDYSKTKLSPGLVCYNTNNYTKCIVLNGDKGNEHDRCSVVLELYFGNRFQSNTVPNRALIPTGEIINLKAIEEKLYISSDDFKKRVWGGANG